jgi:DNA-binding beta-propeller fold protein YncE
MYGVKYYFKRFRRIRNAVFLFLSILTLVHPIATYGSSIFSPAYSTGLSIITASFDENIAPEFPENMEWLNTDEALKLWKLRGKKIVLLSFWRYSSIECQHILPDLARLEKNYADELVIIGIHCGRFTSEKDTENIRQAILRLEIKYPVVNDADLQICYIYSVQALPALVLIDPTGRIVAQHSGEGVFKVFDRTIDSIIKESEKQGLINRNPLKFFSETNQTNESMLSFPAGILADEQSERLFISDTGHSRIIITDFDGNMIDICGSEARGYVDGSFKLARFNRPHGLALSGKKLFVADTENHCIRTVDLSRKIVSTLAGIGRQGHSLSIRGKTSLAVLSSPWDLQVVGDNLYVTMTGMNQIYSINLKNNEISLFAGTGIEGCIDGSRKKAALAQPSGLTSDGKKLYFTDSESCSVRQVDIFGEGVVTTIIGSEKFQFGDRDGRGADALLQHPMGLTYCDELLFVADALNNKIKVIYPLKEASKTLFGDNKAGNTNRPIPLFDEPLDVSFARGKLFIADTNNHSVRVANVKTGKVITLQIKEPETKKEK